MIATNHWMGAICNANHSIIMIATNHWMGAICNAHHASCIMIATNHWMGAVLQQRVACDLCQRHPPNITCIQLHRRTQTQTQTQTQTHVRIMGAYLCTCENNTWCSFAARLLICESDLMWLQSAYKWNNEHNSERKLLGQQLYVEVRFLCPSLKTTRFLNISTS